MEPDAFLQRNRELTEKMSADPEVRESTRRWMNSVLGYEYQYHFTWLGVPIIQFPSDIVVMQEVVWNVQPDLIIETGIARGGSVIFYASMMELIGGDGHVVGVDIDIRAHNREAIERHPIYKRVTMIEGSSVAESTVGQVRDLAEGRERVMVVLDSKHTHEHVLAELRAYGPLVTKGSYLVVFDTVIEDIPEEFNRERPWGKGNNPKTAVHEFLKENDAFAIDKDIEKKLLVTVSPDGFLKKIK